MQLGVDVTCIHTSFGGRGLSGFGDMATFQKRPNFPFGAWTVHDHGKIQSIGIGSKNLCKQGLISSACTSILVGVVSSVSEIKISLWSIKVENFNRSESAQKILATRG